VAYREYSVGGGAQSRGAVVLACGRDAGEAGGVEEEEKEVLLHKVTGTVPRRLPEHHFETFSFSCCSRPGVEATDFYSPRL